MSIYLDLIRHAQSGHKYRINLKDKTLKINKKEIPLTGNLINESDIIHTGFFDEADEDLSPWQIITILYMHYKTSAPSAIYNGNKPYFHAVDVDELNEVDLAFNIPRNIAQAYLEGYVLLASLNGDIEWQNDKHWFWQAKHDKDLIILKEWIV